MLAVEMNWDLLNRYQDAMSPTMLVGTIIAATVAVWLIFQVRARFREDSGRADDKLEMLTQFRELRQQGELTEDEYRLIKGRLARDAARQMDATPKTIMKSAKAAGGDVQQEGGTGNTGETVQDDSNRQVSRSTDEPPNLNSATVKNSEMG
ncbi:MAG: hypothetical protein JWP89_2014 [Schlesneria sp.]|nr:hypothetical protein [Schlesneria sp.]